MNALERLRALLERVSTPPASAAKGASTPAEKTLGELRRTRDELARARDEGEAQLAVSVGEQADRLASLVQSVEAKMREVERHIARFERMLWGKDRADTIKLRVRTLSEEFSVADASRRQQIQIEIEALHAEIAAMRRDSEAERELVQRDDEQQ